MSSSDIAIRAENLSKCYRIGLAEEMHDTVGQAIVSFIKSPVRNYRRHRSLYKFNDIASEGFGGPSSDVIWALRDVSFEVKTGDVLGIVGRNGAGKSTLLKILSKITPPTTGRAYIRGKVSSLLEVGTGFHQELTGRENIYLNGTILGMKKVEIDGKFDEIVDFSGVERFLDTPVKRYSSGMLVRLAFAVAAHLEPEILVIDEVLAVGDAAFQKKCLGKMQNITKEGRTVLFVSHNMGAVVDLCPRAVTLRDGCKIDQGPAKDVVERYLSSLFAGDGNGDLTQVVERSGDGRLRFFHAAIHGSDGEATRLPISGHSADIVLDYRAEQELRHVRVGLTIYNQMGVAVTHCSIQTKGEDFTLPAGTGRLVCRVPRLPLPLGNYKVSVAAKDDHGMLDAVSNACVFDIETSNFFGTATVPPMRYAAALVEHSWQLIPHGDGVASPVTERDPVG